MKRNTIHLNEWVLIILVLLLTTLSITSGCLYTDNKNYKIQNRNLIIQNDSILSRNIELKEIMNNYKRGLVTE